MKLRSLAIIGILIAASIAAVAQPATTTLSGTVYDQTGAGKSGMKLYVVKTLKDGVVLAAPQTVATSGVGGTISLTVLRGSTIYLYSRDIPRFSSRGPAGIPYVIPDTATASIESLVVLTSVMAEQGDTVAGNASGHPARIAGNTTTTPKYYRQVGSSGIAGLPTWAQILLTEVGDISISSPTNGQVLKYNSTLGKWTNQADATGGGGGGSLTVQEVDGSPAVASVSIIEFAQAQGFVVTDQGGGTARVDLSAVPYSALSLTGSILNADVNASAAIAYSKLAALTTNRLLVSDGSGSVSVSAVTATEAGYLSGVTSGIQTQIDGKQASDADLTAIAVLSGDGILRKTSGTWGMDSATYLTGNQTITLSGDVTGSGTTAITTTIGAGAVTNDMLAGSIALTKLSITGTPDGTKFLRDDGTWQVPGGGGTVTSVGLSLPAIFSVSGSPVTGSGTLTGSLATQVANTVWAGPATGVDAAPTFRALVAADIPSHNQAWSTITSTPTTLSGYGITDAQGLDSDLTALAGLSGTGIIARTASATFTERTLSGTSNRITVTNGDGVSGNPTFDIGSDVVTLTGSQTLTSKVLTAPDINGGTADALTSLGIRSTGSGAFDLTFANSENLTAGRTLTVAVNDADRTLTVAGNATVSGTNTGDQTITLTGDVTGSGTGSFATTIGSNKVTLGMLAQVATARFLGRTTAGTGDVESLTTAQATGLLDAMVGDSGSGGTKGLVPAPGSGDAAAGKFLKADGTWAAPAGGGSGTVNSGSQYQFAYYAAAGTAVSGTDALVTDASGLIGINKTSSIGAQLHAVSGSASLPAAIFASAVSPTADVLRVSADNGSTTHFAITSTGSPTAKGGTASGELFGAGTSFASGVTNSIVIGNGSKLGGTSTGTIIIGAGLDQSARTLNNVVLIKGTTAIASGSGIFTVINGSSDAEQSVAIGGTVNGPTATTAGSIAIGHGSSTAASVAPGVAIGRSAATTGASQFVSGSSSYPINDVYFGKGVTNATPTAYTINGTGGSGSNIAGADVYLRGGAPTGNAAAGSVALSTYVTGSSGTTLSTTSVRRYIVNGSRKALTDASTNLFEVALPTLKGCMGTVRFEIFASDGTDLQVRRGTVQYSAVNKGGSYTTEIVVLDEAASASAGTLTATWGITGGTNKVTIDVTPSGSLTETTYYIIYTIENNSEQAITIL